MTIYILMGVSGTGKSTIGRAASKALGLPFIDSDDLHSPLNISKMESSVPLMALDREDWRKEISDSLKTLQNANPKTDILLACSALDMKFRKRLRADMDGNIIYLHLQGDLTTLKRRLAARKNHFFKAEMLAGEFAALEMPHRAVTLDIAQPVSAQVDIIAEIIQSGKS